MAAKIPVKPPAAAKAIAKRALEARDAAPKSKKGGLDTKQAGKQGVGSGVARARDIIAGREVNAKQMKAFFDRHEGNYKAALSKEIPLAESKARQAWGLWGGDPMRTAAERAIREAEKKG
jgi:hypothetical protein